MPRRDEIQREIEKLERKLALINRIPEDTFPFGTVALFSANENQTKWFIRKVEEEAWLGLTPTVDAVEKTLADWIMEALESEIGYFEVRILDVPNHPFFASS